MKTLLKTFLFSILFTLLPLSAQAETVTVTVKGMVCSFCAQGIRKTFGKMEAVNKVEVDLEKKLVTIDLKDDKVLSDEEIKESINNAGYDVVSILRGKNA